MVEFALKVTIVKKVTIVIFITEIKIAPVKIFTEAAASVASTVERATALRFTAILPSSNDVWISLTTGATATHGSQPTTTI